MVCLGISGAVVCLWDSRSIRVSYVLYATDINITPLTFVVSHFQTPYCPTHPTDTPSPPGSLP